MHTAEEVRIVSEHPLLKPHRYELTREMLLAYADLLDKHKVEQRELSAARAEAEAERMRLAGCGAAALGYHKRGDSMAPEYASASLDDTLRLYEKYVEAKAEAERLREAFNWMQREGTLHDFRDGSMQFTVYTPTASDLETGVYLAIQEALAATRKEEGNG